MPVTKIFPSGYCMGVINAIEMVKKARNDFPDEDIHIIGMIVHNRYVVEAFRNLGAVTLDDRDMSKEAMIDRISEGVVIFTAHGISDHIKQKALDKGLTVVDASCKFVLNNRELIRKHLDEGYVILYIGKKGHPEAEAILSISDDIHLITGKKDLDSLDIGNKRILVTNQTTMSIYDTRELIDAIKVKYPQALVSEDICDATRSRQEAVMKLTDTDTLIIVGDPRSNNTAQLANIGRNCGISRIIRVEQASDLKDVTFSPDERIAITAGASTPSYLTDSVIGYLKEKDERYLKTDISKIL